MGALTGEDLLGIWEIGQRQSPVERAITVLAVAYPEISRDELMGLTIGQRDGHLLDIRRSLFGERLDGYTECPACGTSLEFSLTVGDIRTTGPSTQNTLLHGVAEGYEWKLRLPNSADLAVAAAFPDAHAARSALLNACVVSARYLGVEAALDTLPEPVVNALTEQMGEADPQADVQLDLSCVACGHRWQAVFDIVSFLWSEICTCARCLLREVHVLARTYGWREADILGMSAARRRWYLEMAVG